MNESEDKFFVIVGIIFVILALAVFVLKVLERLSIIELKYLLDYLSDCSHNHYDIWYLVKNNFNK
jgi:hypothetical protein